MAITNVNLNRVLKALSILAGIFLGINGASMLLRLALLPLVLLGIYFILFAALIVLLELERPKFVLERVQKYAFFLTTLRGKAAFYLFLGTLNFSPMPLAIITAVLLIGVAVVMLVLPCTSFVQQTDNAGGPATSAPPPKPESWDPSLDGGAAPVSSV
eukprot:PLAT5497.1.p1 GENE.PLAT5497.1~~PLAT5497.1.p1  ORF type:complete len:170 (+),score=54.48 PLAT5497.1:37-510(+)